MAGRAVRPPRIGWARPRPRSSTSRSRSATSAARIRSGAPFQIASPGEPQPHYQIVGLVKDTKYTDLREDFTPIGYLPAAQETEVGPFLDLVVRSDLPLVHAARPR